MMRTEEQRRAIETHDKNLCVDAGAGSGKTSVLVDHILHLLESKLGDLDEIVAITFTEKAAAEMKERLRVACRDKAPLDDPEGMNFWRRIERRVESARISTIHSFCMALLKEHALSLGKDPDFRILTEPESYLLREEVIEEAMHNLLESDDGAAFRLATEFRGADLTDMLRKLLGDRAVVDRILDAHPVSDPPRLLDDWRRIAKEQQAEHFLRLAASEAVAEYRRQLLALSGCCHDASDKRELLRQTLLAEIERARSTANPDVTADAYRNIRALDAHGGSAKKWTSKAEYDTVKDVRKALADLIDKCTFAAIDADLEAKAAELTSDLCSIYVHVRSALEEAKNRRNACDFEDLIAQTVRMLRDDSRGEDSVCRRVARTIKFLLIDEFQDTDSVQLEIARRLAEAPRGPQLFIVGDAKQSIYYFRGAEVEVFQSARGQADETIRMDKNFRTLPDVLHFVNAFFAESTLLRAVEPAYGPMQWHRAATGECRVEFLIPPTSEEATAAAYRDAEAELLANRILTMCAGPDRVQVYDRAQDGMRDAGFGDVAVLFRSLSDVYRYERALRLAGVPYTLVAGSGFYERQEVVDLRNLLTVVVDPWNEMALLAVLRSPFVAVSDEALVHLCGEVGRPSGLARAFYEGTMSGDPEQDERLERARALLDDLRAHREMPLTDFVQHVLERTAYEAILLGQFLGVQRASNLRKIADLAAVFARSETPKLTAFVRYLNEVTSPAIREGEAAIETEGGHHVTLMTVHKSKGLEFPIVAVADMGRDVRGGFKTPLAYHRLLGMAVKVTDDAGERAAPPFFEAVNALRTHEERAEQARVLYVAMTRARDFLLLGGPPDARGNDHWFAAFDRVYGICKRSDGEELTGEGWRARVRRKATPVSLIPSAAPAEDVPPVAAIEARIAPVGPFSRRAESVAVTRLLHAFDERISEEPPERVSTFQAGRVAPMLRGTLAHRFLELWDFRSDPRGLIEELILSECPFRKDRAPMREHLGRLAARIAGSEFGTQLAQSGRLRKEIPFALRIGDALVRGTIDLILDDGAIVDYKTGPWTPEKHASYERQVRLYAGAVRELLGLDVPVAYLCYLDSEEEAWRRTVDVSGPLVKQVLDEAERVVQDLADAPADPSS